MLAFGSSSFAVLGVLYALLTVLLLTSWRGRRIGVYLITACVTSVLWSGLQALELAGRDIPRELQFVVEVLRAGTWILFLSQAGLSRIVRYIANGTWLAVLVAGGWVIASNKLLGTAGSLEAVALPGGLVVSLIGLVLIEQIYRNASPALRSSTKALAIGLGGVFAYDLFLFSFGVLFNEIDQATWLARGAVNILFVPLIALAVRRNPDWGLNIFVSRQIVFYSTTLVAVGAYLLLVSVGGYLLLLYGGAWGRLARAIFFAGSGVALIALLFSNVLRARLRVFLSKHFFQNKYDYRDEWLRLVATLAEFEDSSTRRVVIRAMAQIVESPAGILWTRGASDENFVVAATYETDDVAHDIDAHSSLIRFIESNGWIVDLDEFAEHPGRYDGLELPGWILDRDDAWLIVPLIFRSDVLGLVLLDAAPGRSALNYEDRDLLKTVGNHIAVHLAQESSDSLLAQAKQFEAYNRLTAFLMHDLKNLIAQQSLIVENAERHKTNPEFVDDMVETIAGGVSRMRRVIDHLRQTSIQPASREDRTGQAGSAGCIAVPGPAAGAARSGS